MTKSIKAVLLSAFVIPGAGHLYLKQYFVGFIFISMTLVSFYILLSIAIEAATNIVDMILNGEVAADIATITHLVTNEVTNANTSSANLATIGFVIVWILAVLDSYRLGKKGNNIEISNELEINV